MLAEIYIEALLVDPDVADEFWVLWDQRLATTEVTAFA